jgi:hypothetical protein
MEAIKNICVKLNLTPSASEFILMLWGVVQFFDDVLDNDKQIEREDTEKVLVNVLIRLPLNQFYVENGPTLIPVLANALITWKASDTMERKGEANERSFVYRSSFYSVLLSVYTLSFGLDAAMADADKILNLYGETYSDYKTEFKIP